MFARSWRKGKDKEWIKRAILIVKERREERKRNTFLFSAEKGRRGGEL